MDIRACEDADPKGKGQVFRPDRYLCVDDCGIDCKYSQLATILYFQQPILQRRSKPSRPSKPDTTGMLIYRFYYVQPGPLAFCVQLPGTFLSNRTDC